MNVNWWLAGLAFLLGLVITLVFMIRRVEREVPVYGAGGRGGAGASRAGLASGRPKVATPDVDAPDLDVSDADVPDVDAPTATVPTVGTTGPGVPKVDLPDGSGVGTAAAGAAGGAATAKFARSGGGAGDSDADAPTTAVPKVPSSGVGTVAAAAAGAAGSGSGTGDSETAKIAAVGEEPYGAGSLRVARGATAPSGYTIKGNEDSMLYHSPQSPSYKRTIAEVWFRDVETAEAAGFNRWDSGKSQRGES